MIYDMINALDTAFRDPTTGINAQIATLNTELSEDAPLVAHIQTWGDEDGTEARLPSQMPDYPALVFSWLTSRNVSLVSQKKRRVPAHNIQASYFDVEPDQNKGRRYMALFQTAFMRVLDTVPDADKVDEVMDVNFAARRWSLAGQGEDVGRLEINFNMQERDENA